MRKTIRGLVGAAFAVSLALTGCGADEEVSEVVVPTEGETPPRVDMDTEDEDSEG